MREGRSLNHYGYSFLSYWRVLELAFPLGKTRGAWVTATLPTLAGAEVHGALASIVAQGVTDVGEHLLVSGRHAIAHAKARP